MCLSNGCPALEPTNVTIHDQGLYVPHGPLKRANGADRDAYRVWTLVIWVNANEDTGTRPKAQIRRTWASDFLLGLGAATGLDPARASLRPPRLFFFSSQGHVNGGLTTWKPDPVIYIKICSILWNHGWTKFIFPLEAKTGDPSPSHVECWKTFAMFGEWKKSRSNISSFKFLHNLSSL